MAATAESVDLGELHEAEPFLEEPQASTKGIKSVGFGFTLIAALGCAIYAAFWAIGPQSPHLNEDGVISVANELSLCSAGVLGSKGNASFCCPKSCGTCGGKGCNKREGGSDCCTGVITRAGKICKSSEDVACKMGVWSGCYSHANCGDRNWGWRAHSDRDKCIKADCKTKSLIYPEYKQWFEKCETGETGLIKELFQGYRGFCVKEEVFSGCHSDASCDLGKRDKCIEADCEKQGMKYPGPKEDQVWERCGGLLENGLFKNAKFKGLCE